MAKKGAFSKIIVSGVILANVVFTAAVLWVFYKIRTEPTTLITFWFSFTTVEVWSLSNIKKTQIKKENKND